MLAGEHQPPLLEVRDLAVEFRTPSRTVHAVVSASYTVSRGESLAVVGESGSGKSVTVQAILGLLDRQVARITAGEVRFAGENLLRMRERERRALRGAKLALVPQDAMAALNPLIPVGRQIAEMFTVHGRLGRREAGNEAVRLMEHVGIPSASRRANQLPHEFSGGMRQRLVIAMAISLSPDVLIADEATSALDVTTQLQVVSTLDRLRRELGMAVIFITHDLLSARGADRVAVMYAGRVVESGPAAQVFARPAHPYTEALLLSTPRLGGSNELRPIPGRPPGHDRVPTGCPFAPRCIHRRDRCLAENPPLREVAQTDWSSACHYAPNFEKEAAAL